MKKIFSMVFWGLNIGVMAQGPVNTNTTVQSAVVYLQGAELTSFSKVNIAPGQQEIIFEGLSNFVNPQSVQVMTSNENVTILSAVFQVNYLKAKVKDPKYMLIKDSIEFLSSEISKVSNQKFSFQEEQNMVLSNKEIGGQNTGVTLIELQKIADFFRQRLLSVRNEISALEIKERKLNEILIKYQQQLNTWNTGLNYPLGEISVVVDASASASASFKLSYFLPQAGWNPVYDVRVKDIKDQPKLSYKAEVFQNTGINWKDVKLTLSTGNPTLGGNQPVLSTYFLNFIEPPRIYKNEMKRSGAMQSRDVPAVAAPQQMYAEESYDYNAPAVAVSENQINAVFEVKTNYDVPTGGKKHLVALSEYPLKAEYKYYAVPKLDKDAFLLARITEWEKIQLLPGNANVFFEGAYVGQTWLNPNSTDDTLDVSLGRDKKVIVTREKIVDYEKEKFVGLNKKQTFAFDYSIRNTKNIPIQIEILDQIPVSMSSEIEVKPEDLGGGSLNATTGEVKWNFNLQPVETRKFKFIYGVKYPKDKKLNF